MQKPENQKIAMINKIERMKEDLNSDVLINLLIFFNRTQN